MFARVFALLPLALLASASHLEARDSCSTGPINCCNQVQTYNEASGVLGLFGGLFANAPVNALIGFNCSPLGVVAASGNSCTSQTVCCDQNNFNGLINVGCSPINANL